MKKVLSLEDIPLSNKDFWRGYTASAFPTALDKERDQSLTEFIEEKGLADIGWWDNFTGYYDGVLEESDGYSDTPTTLLHALTAEQTLKIEFHPGDTVYYVNGRQIACTGPSYQIQVFPFKDLLKYLEAEKSIQQFLLLLPLVRMDKEDAAQGTDIISEALREVFDASDCGRIAASIVCGLTEG